MQTKLSMEEIYGKNIYVCKLSSLQKLDKVILANVSKHEPLFMGVHESHCLQTWKIPKLPPQKIFRNTLNLCKLPIFSVTSASIDTKSFLCFPFSFLSCRSISTRVVYCLMRDFSFTCKTVIFLLFSESIFFISFESIWRALSRFCREPHWRY